MVEWAAHRSSCVGPLAAQDHRVRPACVGIAAAIADLTGAAWGIYTPGDGFHAALSHPSPVLDRPFGCGVSDLRACQHRRCLPAARQLEGS